MDKKVLAIGAVVVVIIIAIAGITLAMNNKGGDDKKETKSTIYIEKYGGGTGVPSLYIKDADGNEVELFVGKTITLPNNGSATIYSKDSGWKWDDANNRFENDYVYVHIEITGCKSLTHKDNNIIEYGFTYDQGKELVLKMTHN